MIVLIVIAGFLTRMIGVYQIIYSDILKKFGVRILLMCSQIVKIIRSTDFIQNIGIQVQQVWMLLHMTGLEKIVG